MPLRCVAIWLALLLSSLLVDVGSVYATGRVQTVHVERERRICRP